MRIAITGTRGIPNEYGGFEQFAEYVSAGLSERGHDVLVYNPSYHAYDQNVFRGASIIRKNFYCELLGSAGNYLYDLSCMRDALRRKADIILECGYASAAPWYPCLRRKGTKLVTHMDGMERQREKWGRITRSLFMRAEKSAVRYSDALVCDHPEIAGYYERAYSVRPAMIAYGADPGQNWDPEILHDLQLDPGRYNLLVARLEPENKIRMIIEGFLASDALETLVIIGRHDTGYGRSIHKDFADDTRIRFLGGLYRRILDHLRHFSKAVFHGHSVGGTNPSLLETMAAGAHIIAHDNIYNRWVLGNNADWFDSAGSITDLLSGSEEKESSGMKKSTENKFIANNLKRIRADFNWKDVVRQYEELFESLLQEK